MRRIFKDISISQLEELMKRLKEKVKKGGFDEIEDCELLVQAYAAAEELKELKEREHPGTNVVERSKIDKAIEQMIEEKEFAYSDFDEYKYQVLGVDDKDDLPDDDYRYGMERCIEILKGDID